MKLEEIKKIAQQHDIKVGRMKKAELVKTIQQAEGNAECFETGTSNSCGQENCMWREDCD